MVVKLKELNKAPKGGIYALAPDIPSNPKVRFPIKVGRTINFKDRLNAYHLCFNGGFRLIAILPLKNTTPQDDRKKLSMLLEKEAGKMLGKPRTYANREARGSEWYDATVGEIHKIFETIHKNLKKDDKYVLTKPPILEFDENYINIYEIDVVKKFPVPIYVKKNDGGKILLSKTTTSKAFKKSKKTTT